LILLTSQRYSVASRGYYSVMGTLHVQIDTKYF